MFPFRDGLFAPKNAWYVAAWSDEVTRTPIERWIMDAPVAFYRREDGTPVALEGRCPHHLYPLGKSTTVGDNIRCGYHGLQFKPDGTAASAPFLEKVPAACRIKSYPVREHWQWIWIWTGDPSLADENLIPDHFEIGLTDPSFDSARGLHYEVNARYQLINDNLLDLQHLEVLHGDNIGVPGIGQAPECRDSGDGWISSYRRLHGVSVPEFFEPVLDETRGVVDRENGLRFYIPGLHAGYDALFIPEGEPEGGKELGRFNVYHAVTPARKNSCHYFLTGAAHFDRRIPDIGPMLEMSLPVPTLQDVRAAEDIEAMIAAADGVYEEMLFKSDATLVMGRRMMEEMMEGELSPPSIDPGT